MWRDRPAWSWAPCRQAVDDAGRWCRRGKAVSICARRADDISENLFGFFFLSRRVAEVLRDSRRCRLQSSHVRASLLSDLSRRLRKAVLIWQPADLSSNLPDCAAPPIPHGGLVRAGVFPICNPPMWLTSCSGALIERRNTQIDSTVAGVGGGVAQRRIMQQEPFRHGVHWKEKV